VWLPAFKQKKYIIDSTTKQEQMQPNNFMNPQQRNMQGGFPSMQPVSAFNQQTGQPSIAPMQTGMPFMNQQPMGAVPQMTTVMP
jgi:hypothetical protein